MVGKDGEYTPYFFAQKDYASRSVLDITMEDFGFEFNDIDRADVEVNTYNPRTVELDKQSSTISLELSRSIDEGDEVKVLFLASAGITNPSDPGTYAWVVDEDYPPLGNNGLLVALGDVVEPVTDDGLDEVAGFVAASDTPGKVTRYEFAIPLRSRDQHPDSRHGN